jgi:hypothetical protein
VALSVNNCKYYKKKHLRCQMNTRMLLQLY